MKKISVILLAVCTAGVLSAYETMDEAYKAASVYRNEKNYKKAFDAFKEAAKLSKKPSQKANAEYMSGIVLCEDKQYNRGIAQLRKTLAAAPTAGLRVSCQFHIAYYLGVMKKYGEAIAEMRKVRDYGNGEVKSRLIDRADCYIGNYLMALRRYNDAIDIVRDSCNSEDTVAAFMALRISYLAYKELKTNEGRMTAVNGLLNLKDPQPHMYFTARKYAFELARALKNHEEALKYADEIVTNSELSDSQRAYGVFYKALCYSSLHDKRKELAQWKLLRNCGVKYLENVAANNLRRLHKKK